MKSIFSLEGKNAWITGAAYGIGFAIAKAYVEAGARMIVFNVRSEEAKEKALQSYKEAGIDNVRGYVCDVTNEEEVAALVERIHQEVGQIDILVNNAGIIKRIPMHEMKREEFQQVIDIDLVGPFICAKTPAGRWLNPDELGGPAVFLASKASDAVNGHILYVDGGILAYIGKQP